MFSMDTCIRCSVGENEVRLFDAIYEGRMGSICERCSIIENIPIIKKPDVSQLKESEKGVGVYSRMKRLSGIREVKEEETFFPEDKLGELDANPEMELPQEEQLKLIEHFHWEIMKNRRRKGLSPEQLAETLGESEAVVEMVEKAKLPENAEQVIRKLEQFFQVRLRKVDESEKVIKEEKEPVLLDEEGRELDFIPEERIESFDEPARPEISESEVHCRVDVKRDFETPLLEDSAVVKCEVEKPTTSRGMKIIENESDDVDEGEPLDLEKEDFDVRRADINRIKVGDLQTVHRKKIEATRQEKIDEQRKIEERQRLIEARKEEFRMRKERESKDLDSFLGGVELLDKKESDLIEDSKKVEEFDRELI